MYNGLQAGLSVERSPLLGSPWSFVAGAQLADGPTVPSFLVFERTTPPRVGEGAEGTRTVGVGRLDDDQRWAGFELEQELSLPLDVPADIFLGDGPAVVICHPDDRDVRSCVAHVLSIRDSVPQHETERQTEWWAASYVLPERLTPGQHSTRPPFSPEECRQMGERHIHKS